MAGLIHLNKIVVMMAIALMGLIALQCYWIKRDLDLASQQLDQRVSLALNQTAERYLEKQITDRPHQQVVSFWKDIEQNTEEYFFQTDTFIHQSGAIQKNEVEVRVELPKIVKKINKSAIDRLDVREDTDGQVRVYISAKGKDSSWVVKREETIVANQKNSLTTTSQVYVNSHESSTKKREHEIVIEEFVYHEGAIDNDSIIEKPLPFSATNAASLDSLLQQAFGEHGLAMTYASAIHNNDTDDWLFASSLFQKSNLEGWQVPLISRNIPSGQYFLHIQLPNKDNYLFQETLAVTLSSILLIALIASCFWVVVRTVLQQKKVAAIKTDFINNMTHEFKTPISNVALALEALLNFGKLKDPATAKMYIEIAQKENSRLGKQVEKVLQMALLERNDFELKYKTIDMHSLIQEVASSFQTTVSQRGGALQLYLNASHPHIHGDELHLSNVLANLIDNANKYSPEAPQITISTQQTAEGFQVSVADQGIGIGKEHQSKIFEKFYRVPTGNLHNIKGFGLGLSYVGQTVEKHGGSIQVVSNVGAGSCFTILLSKPQ